MPKPTMSAGQQLIASLSDIDSSPLYFDYNILSIVFHRGENKHTDTCTANNRCMHCLMFIQSLQSYERYEYPKCLDIIRKITTDHSVPVDQCIWYTLLFDTEPTGTDISTVYVEALGDESRYAFLTTVFNVMSAADAQTKLCLSGIATLVGKFCSFLGQLDWPLTYDCADIHFHPDTCTPTDRCAQCRMFIQTVQSYATDRDIKYLQRLRWIIASNSIPVNQCIWYVLLADSQIATEADIALAIMKVFGDESKYKYLSEILNMMMTANPQVKLCLDNIKTLLGRFYLFLDRLA